jgi:hypothetical protein
MNPTGEPLVASHDGSIVRELGFMSFMIDKTGSVCIDNEMVWGDLLKTESGRRSMVQGRMYQSLVRWRDVRGVWCEDKGWTGIRWGRKHAQWARRLPAYVERLGWTWKMKRIKHEKKLLKFKYGV